MSDQEEDKKNLIDDNSSSENDNQSEVDSNNQPLVEENQNIETTSEGSENNLENPAQNENLDTSNEKIEENFSPDQTNDEKTSDAIENTEQTSAETEVSENLNENKEENDGSTHQVIHKKDGRLHIYVRQDKYKGELKSKNWVGRLYIDGKQKISSSGTTNLEEAIPILEKWFDDVHEESERLKNQTNETEITTNEAVPEVNTTQNNNETSVQPDAPVVTEQNPVATEQNIVNQTNENQNPVDSAPVSPNESAEPSKQDQIKSKLSNVFWKIKRYKTKTKTLLLVLLTKNHLISQR